MKKDKTEIREDSTLPGCIGTGNPIPPNRCDTCAHHSDYTCTDLKIKSKEK